MSVPIVSAIGASAATAAAQSDSAAPCAAAADAQLTATLTSDGTATYTVGNALPLCDPMAIGLAVYLKNADGFVVPQTLSDSSTDTITSGSKTLTVTFPDYGVGPACYFQLDAFTGDVLPEITDTSRYNERLLAYRWGVLDTCILGESTSTSTSTTATTTTTTTITGGHTNPTAPAQVEGEQIARGPAQTAPLARTGANDVSALTTLAGALLLAGGLLTAALNRRRAPSS